MYSHAYAGPLDKTGRLELMLDIDYLMDKFSRYAIQMFERTFNCLKLSNQTVNSVMGLLSWNRTFAQSLSQPTWLPGRGSPL